MSQHSWPFLLNIFCTIVKKKSERELFGGFWGAPTNLHELWCVFMWPPDVEQAAWGRLSCPSCASDRPAHAGLRCPVKPLKQVREGCGELLSVLSPSIKWPFWMNVLALFFSSTPSLHLCFPDFDSLLPSRSLPTHPQRRGWFFSFLCSFAH